MSPTAAIVMRLLERSVSGGGAGSGAGSGTGSYGGGAEGASGGGRVVQPAIVDIARIKHLAAGGKRFR